MDDMQALARLRKLSMRSVGPAGLEPILSEILDTAIAIAGADFGNLQLIDAATSDLRIAVHRGFPDWWIEFWNVAAKRQGVSGSAVERRERVVVDDVASSPLFVGKPALEMQLRAHVRAVQSTPLLTRSGKAVGVLSTHHRRPHHPDERVLRWLDLLARQAADIIDSTRTGTALHDEQQRLQALLQSLPVGVAFTNSPACDNVQGNATLFEQFGAMPGDNVSASAHDAHAHGRQIVYLHDGVPVAPEELPLQRAAREGRTIAPMELEVHLPSGKQFFAEISGAPIRNAHGDLIGAVTVSSDITERKLAAETREQARLKDEFLAVLSHELRNPLAALSGAVEALKGDLAFAERDEMDRLIRRQVGVLRRLVDDLLDISRITHGKIRLQREPVSLLEVLDTAAAAIQPATDQRSQRLVIEAPTVDVRFEADRVRLQQIAANLLDNASKYTERGGTIHLAGALEGAEIVLRCKDNGPGIALEMQERIFEPLVRVESGARDAPQGLGLGLPLVRRLAELHGGSAAVRSAGLGRGSEFIVRIPFATPALVSTPSSAAPAMTRARQAASVVIVEDNADVAQWLTFVLKRAGHRVSWFADGASALSGLPDLAPDAVLVDIGLPEMSGYELLAAMRLQAHLAHALFIGMSGLPPTVEEQAGPTRFDHYLVKPMSSDRILALIAEHLNP